MATYHHMAQFSLKMELPRDCIGHQDPYTQNTYSSNLNAFE